MVTVDERLNTLESELNEMRQQLTRQIESLCEQFSSNWIDRISGSFRDVPEFDEVLRRGRQVRAGSTNDRSYGVDS